MSDAIPIPSELVEPHLRPTAAAELIRLIMRGAKPERLVLCRILNGAWVARWAFEAIQTADGPIDHFQATLRPHPEADL